FVVCPGFSGFFNFMSVYKNLFDAFFIGIVLLILLIKSFYNLKGIYYKKPDWFIDLWSSNADTVRVVHGFPHVFNQFLQIGVIRLGFLALFSKNRMTISHNV